MATASDAAAFGPLLAAADRLARPFLDAGHQLHLVGGSVRDALLGADSGGDLDLTTDARPEQTLALVRTLTEVVWTQGERFGTIGAEIDGRPFEITTHRTERYDSASRNPEVQFADALEEDLARRDFTINAMAVVVPGGELVDPYGGRSDLAAKVLRTPLAPEISFGDDPLRMLRAGRFVARFDLRATDELTAAARDHAARLDIVSVERTLDEVTKLLRTERPSPGVRFLAETGVLSRVLPEADLDAPIDVLDADPSLRLAAWFVSVQPAVAERRLRQLKASNDLVRSVRRLIEAVRSLPEDPDPASARRWVALGPEWKQALELASVVGADRALPLRTVIETLAQTEDLDDQTLPVDGADVMAELSIPSGPGVGEALQRLREHRYEVGPFSRTEAIEFLHED